MILYFPNFDTLRLSLTSGLIPPGVSSAPVVASFDDKDGLWVKTAASLPRAAQAELRKLGVPAAKNLGSRVCVELSCWPQLLPLQREENLTAPSGQTPVLFELPQSDLLPTLVGEMLRLGNDRQGFRWLDGNGESRALLRVVGPPYYTLLRALDRNNQTSAPRAYVERAPRVWVEVGHTHPLLDQVRQPEGKVLLLRPPRDWLVLNDAPFRDIYEILEFNLPHAAVRWRDLDRHERMPVPLRLAPGGGHEAAELWVLREDAVAQLDNLVRNAGDELLARLLFAVGESDGRQAVILRTRPSKQTPPVLVLKGQDFRPFQKLPNLFLPCGKRLQPNLRRDAVRKLLADDPEHITWLYPHADGTFTPESLPDIVFRPLSDWIDYILDHDRAALNAWIQSTEFDFERFICRDEEDPARVKKEPKAPRPDRQKNDEGASADTAAVASIGKSRKKEAPPENEPLAALHRAEPSELQKQLKAVEDEFLALEGPLDAPERLALWPQLAMLNTALNTDQNRADAALCWVNALWQDSADTAQWAHTWATAEARGDSGDRLAVELERLLARAEPSPGNLRTVAACVIWAGQQAQPEPAVLQRLNQIRQFLQKHESLLPVRAVWLAWLAVCKLSHGDVLALARTRDRLLERLFQHGLTPEVDLPSFLRFAGDRSSERFRAFRDWLLPLPERIKAWVGRVKSKDKDAEEAQTEAYAYLLLAFGLARLGESNESQRLYAEGRQVLDVRGEVHPILLRAFDHRIEQALQGQPAIGPLPAELTEQVEEMVRKAGEKDGRRLRYSIDRLRQYSKVLEPHEKIDPYRHYKAVSFDELMQALSALQDVRDRKQVEEEIARLLHQHAGKSTEAKEARARIVSAALELAPRVSQAFAVPLLERVSEVCETLSEPLQQAALLEKALFVATHFDEPAQVHALVTRFHALLDWLGGQGGLSKEERAKTEHSRLQALDTLAGQCFRGLRKLGMRDEIHTVLRHLGEAILQGQRLADLRGTSNWHVVLRSLLHVAAGWFYFGKDEQALPILEEVRTLLYKGSLIPQDQKKLACVYVATLGQAPAQVAMQGLNEMFQKLERVHDNFTTSRYFSLSQLDVIETLVLAVVTEDFALGTAARRWLDDEEFMVRRRIHHDLHALLQHCS